MVDPKGNFDGPKIILRLRSSHEEIKNRVSSISKNILMFRIFKISFQNLLVLVNIELEFVKHNFWEVDLEEEQILFCFNHLKFFQKPKKPNCLFDKVAKKYKTTLMTKFPSLYQKKLDLEETASNKKDWNFTLDFNSQSQ